MTGAAGVPIVARLETARLAMRRWTVDDLGPFAAMNADPEVMRYFPAPLDRAASDAFVDRIEAQFDRLGYSMWALELRATGQFIGFTGLLLQTFPAHFTPAVEVGWRLARPAWGQGLATEAAHKALDIGFGAAHLQEIVSMTARTNDRSQRVMRRLGMIHDPADDFDHPVLPEGHPLRPHVLFRISRSTTAQSM
jgi:RimJ/RimL family protein N-acetyltransferase